MTKDITKAQHLQLIGLMALADTLRRLEDIESSIRELLKVQPEDSEVSGIGSPEHIGDAIYSRYSVDETLRLLGVTVGRTEAER